MSDESGDIEAQELHVTSDAVGVAQLYLDAMVKFGRLDAAQALMTPDYRLARAQIWLWNNRHAPDIDGRDLDQLAEGLASSDPQAHLWLEFEASEVHKYQEAFGEWWGRLGMAGRPRPLAPGLEHVLFADMAELHARFGSSGEDGRAVVNEPYALTNHAVVLVEDVDGRPYVAGHGDVASTPGWPPSGL